MVTSEKKKLTIDDFETIRLLGKGEYGKVLLVRKKASGNLYALKIIKKKLIEKKKQIQHTKAERSILQKVDHPYIIHLKYAFHTSLKLYLVLEYCPGGELYFHINKYKRLSEDRAKFYSACIVLALDYLHERDIVYRDLKPENIVIDSEGYPKITDFGLSKENVSYRDLTMTMCGTPEYIAPEVLLRQGYGQAIDWWSLGCIIYEMLTGLPPFYHKVRKDVYRSIIEKPARLSCYLSPLAMDLVTKLLAKNPQQRLGARNSREVMEHEWFRDIDWTALYLRQLKPNFVPSIKDPLDSKYFSEDFTSTSVHESPDIDEVHGLSPTYIDFSYSGESNCCLESLKRDI